MKELALQLLIQVSMSLNLVLIVYFEHSFEGVTLYWPLEVATSNTDSFGIELIVDYNM